MLSPQEQALKQIITQQVTVVDVGMCSPLECSNVQSAGDHFNCSTAEAPWREHALPGSTFFRRRSCCSNLFLAQARPVAARGVTPPVLIFLNSRHVDPWPSLEISFSGCCRGTRCSASSGLGHARQHPRPCCPISRPSTTATPVPPAMHHRDSNPTHLNWRDQGRRRPPYPQGHNIESCWPRGTSARSRIVFSLPKYLRLQALLSLMACCLFNPAR